MWNRHYYNGLHPLTEVSTVGTGNRNIAEGHCHTPTLELIDVNDLRALRDTCWVGREAGGEQQLLGEALDAL